MSEQRRGSAPGTAAPRVTSSRDPPSCPCGPPYLEVRAVVTVGVHDLPLPPVPRQHCHHFSSCQVSVELGGEDADAGSGQRLGEGWLKPFAQPRPSPLPRIPFAARWGPAIPVLAPARGVRGSLCPWSSVGANSPQRDRRSVCGRNQFMRCRALSQREQLSQALLASSHSLVVVQMIPFG